MHEGIREKHILGRQTRTQVVRADTSDDRPWLRKAPVCAMLAEHNVAHCGIMHASHPMEIVRTELSGTFFLASLSGGGQVQVDGQWRKVEGGRACLQPPFIPNALRAQRRRSWSFAWVRYQEMPKARPIVSIHSPAVGAFDGAPLRAALEGLHAEAAGHATPAALEHWTNLVHGYVLSFAQPYRGDDRLQEVWEAVHAELDRPWSLEELADIACVSKEHLRRLARSSLGRSPMQHVTYIRMKRAAELLASTDEKVAHVARRVGYASPFAFSETFLRWAGCRPTEYRARCGVT